MNTLIRCLFVLVTLFIDLPVSAAEPEQAVVKAAADPAAAPAAIPETPAAPVAQSAQTTRPADASSTKPGDGQETAVEHVPTGYKAKVRNGETVYCRSSTPLGTRFPTEVCMSIAQYDEFMRQGDGLRQELTGKQKSLYIPPDPGRGGS